MRARILLSILLVSAATLVVAQFTPPAVGSAPMVVSGRHSGIANRNAKQLNSELDHIARQYPTAPKPVRKAPRQSPLRSAIEEHNKPINIGSRSPMGNASGSAASAPSRSRRPVVPR